MTADNSAAELLAEEESFSVLSYSEIYGSLETSRHSSLNTTVPQLDDKVSSVMLPSPFLNKFQPLGPVCSTPLRSQPLNLYLFDDEERKENLESETFLDCENWNPELELYDGSEFSTTDFNNAFDSIANRHTLSAACRRDILRLFGKILPPSNNISAPSTLLSLPSCTVFEHNASQFVTVNLRQQLKTILGKNISYKKQSWSESLSWTAGTIKIKKKEVLLNINIDGVALFKSRFISVWPVWVQIFNLPPKLRSEFSNHLLLGLWQWKGKPNWSFLFKKISFEIDLFLSDKLVIEGLGECSANFLYLICDMPAMISVCMVQQFNGYYGCPYCYSGGVYQNRRMRYPVQEKLILRQNQEYLKNAMSGKFGVKGISPLSKFFGIPWNVPIDPMHQIFFSSAKILTQALISKVPKNSKEEFNKCLIDCMVPYESLHKPKNVSELNLWKAADFRLFFFHLGPLIMLKSFPVDQLLVELFLRLSKAIRLLSEQKLSEAILTDAENHLEFFWQFLKSFWSRLTVFQYAHLATFSSPMQTNWTAMACFCLLIWVRKPPTHKDSQGFCQKS